MVSSDFVRSYMDAWNQHDPGGVAEHLSLTGCYFDIPVQQQLAREEFIAHLKNYFDGDKNHYFIVGEILTGEKTIAFQYRVSPEETCGPEDGWLGAEFVTMEGEAAAKIEDYYQDPELEMSARRGKALRSHRYAKSGLSSDGLETLMGRLSHFMDNERVFLDSHLSLPLLATMLDCSVNHLSQAINEGQGVSFFDFINQYRVQEATSILGGDPESSPSILDVALTVGFNSTSTFYTAFKKSTGKTPAQFRRALAN